MDSTSGPTDTGFEPSNFFRSFAATVQSVVLKPARFFRDLDEQRPPGSAVVFAVVCGVVGFLLGYVVSPISSWIWGESYPELGRIYWTILALSPLLAWIGLYIFAAFQHLFVAIFIRPRKGFDATLRVAAYSSALALLSWVPVVGHLASAYGLYVTMAGLRVLHETSTTRAMLATLVPFLVFLASTAWSLWP